MPKLSTLNAHRVGFGFCTWPVSASHPRFHSAGAWEAAPEIFMHVATITLSSKKAAAAEEQQARQLPKTQIQRQLGIVLWVLWMRNEAFILRGHWKYSEQQVEGNYGL